MEERDIIILGGGPAGYVAAIRARQLGAKVTLLEKDALGGVCLNRGCTPMRALLRGTEFIDIPRKAKEYGMTFPPPEVDFARLIARKDTIVKTVGGGVQLLLSDNGVEVVKGEGKILSNSEIEVKTDTGNRQFKAKNILICTGASTRKPGIPGEETVIGTEQALSLKEKPQSMLIIGAGPIGLAFATIFCRLGTKVTIADSAPAILSGFDRELVSLLERELKKNRINIMADTNITSISPAESGNTVKLNAGDAESSLTAQYVLVSDSRKPNITGFGLENAGIKAGEGKIQVNNRMETGVPGIYAAGDVVGGMMLAHTAFTEGRIAAENALGKRTHMSYEAVPRCIYSFIEIASVGMTAEEAAGKGYQVKVGKFPFSANSMATTFGERTGMVKVVTETRYGQVLGIHIMGYMASEMIGEATLALKMEVTPAEITSTIHTHPALSEVLMEAALDVTGETIHFISQNK